MCHTINEFVYVLMDQINLFIWKDTFKYSSAIYHSIYKIDEDN